MKIVFQCCICFRYKDINGHYKMFLPINPFTLVSHGYCLECCKKYFSNSEWVKLKENQYGK